MEDRFVENYQNNLIIISDFIQGKSQDLKDIETLKGSDPSTNKINLRLRLLEKAAIEKKQPLRLLEGNKDTAHFKRSLIRDSFISEEFKSGKVQGELKELKDRHRLAEKSFEILVDQIMSRFEGEKKKEDTWEPRRSSNTRLTEFAGQSSKTVDSIERLMIERVANLEQSIKEENANEYIQVKNTLGILISDYLMKLEQLDIALANSEKQNDHLKSKLDDFMKELRQRNESEILQRERYHELTELLHIQDNLHQEHIEMLQGALLENSTTIRDLKEQSKRVEVVVDEKNNDGKREIEESEKQENLKQQLEAELSSKNNLISQLQSQIKDLDQENNTRVDSEKTRNSELQKRIGELNSEISRFLEEENYGQRSSIDGLKLLVSEYARSKARLQKLDPLPEKIESLQRHYDELYEVKQSLAKKVEDLETKIDLTVGQKTKLTDDLKQAEKDLKQLRLVNTQQNSKFEEIQNNLVLVSEKNKTLQQSEKGLKQKLDFLQKAIDVVPDAKQVKETNQGTKLTQQEYKEIAREMELKEKNSELEYLRSRIEQLKTENLALKDQYKPQAEHSTAGICEPSAELDIQILKSQNEILGHQLKGLTDQKTSLESKLNLAQGDIWRLERELKGVREINSQLRESYEIQTGNRNHTPIPSYATGVDKNAVFKDPSPARKGSFIDDISSYGEDDEIELELMNKEICQKNELLEEELKKMVGKLADHKSLLNTAKGHIGILEQELNALKSSKKEDQTRIPEVKKNPQNVNHVSTQAEDNYLDQKLKKIESENSRLQEEVNLLNSQKETQATISSDKSMLNEHQELLDVIETLTMHKTFLIELLIKLGEKDEINFSGIKVSASNYSDIETQIQHILELRKSNPIQGNIYTIERIRIRYVEEKVEDSEFQRKIKEILDREKISIEQLRQSEIDLFNVNQLNLIIGGVLRYVDCSLNDFLEKEEFCLQLSNKKESIDILNEKDAELYKARVKSALTSLSEELNKFKDQKSKMIENQKQLEIEAENQRRSDLLTEKLKEAKQQYDTLFNDIIKANS